MSGANQVLAEEWVTFPGGELEGKHPKVLCSACRDALRREAATYGRSGNARHSRLLCFDCYRADLARSRALKEAGGLDTASDARFQTQLPFEPVDHVRLDRLKAERAQARATASQRIGQYADRRRQAQMRARRALQSIAAGLKARELTPAAQVDAMAAAVHAAELQLPDAWLPYVVSR
jgi:hypothetical protein